MSTLTTAVEQFKRDKIAELLAECTDKQRALFDRLFPNGVPIKELDSAFALCERTVGSNRQKALVSR